jgi:L-lactate dehydrogenase (cytochrome)
MSPADAKRALEHGADGIVVSNHGGRQCDYLPATIDTLPRIVNAIGRQVPVLLDGGVRRGSDVVKAIALGASACMIGRPWLYGLAAWGDRGPERVIQMFKAEIDRTLALLGRPMLADLDATVLGPPTSS